MSDLVGHFVSSELHCHHNTTSPGLGRVTDARWGTRASGAFTTVELERVGKLEEH